MQIPHTDKMMVIRLMTDDEYDTHIRDEVSQWLRNPFRRLPPAKYFYDALGSQLFDEITRLPEYYLTRTETSILEQHADDIIANVEPIELVEIGSGYSRKTQLLLEAMHRAGGDTYCAFDVSEDALRIAGSRLKAQYPWLRVKGAVGDFNRHLDQIPTESRPLVAFLGSTIGNYIGTRRIDFLRQVTTLLGDEGYFLLGVDFIKDVATMEAAYNDSAGVTAQFNRNILRVLNKELEGDIPLDAFEHVSTYDAETSCIKSRLRATRDVAGYFAALDISLTLRAGDELFTEVSCKFTRDSTEDALITAGMRPVAWYTDPQEWFGLVLARRA
ncbi:MAG: L-histidine N(alpha)-methyltransferase [Phototrophicales bacterium]|nr:MAG: L-histidine N(alpha)-methyltransferase [Phototrophicales bacterium]